MQGSSPCPPFASFSRVGPARRAQYRETAAERAPRENYRLAWSPPRGTKSIEKEYIPGVIECELGPLTMAEGALDAQAIAARTYLLRHLLAKGLDTEVATTPRFQCWKPPRRLRAFAAAQRTEGMVMEYAGDVINGNYVSGARQRDETCAPKAPRKNGYEYADWTEMRRLYVDARAARKRHPFKGTSWTEVVVTYNEGLAGEGVLPSPIASIRTANRGALSQWGAICLAEKREYGLEQILQYFYGTDIQLKRRSPSIPPPPVETVPTPPNEGPAGVLVETTRAIPPARTEPDEEKESPSSPPDAPNSVPDAPPDS